MAEPISLFQKKPSEDRHNTNIEKNISYARDWYKKQKWYPQMKIKISDAGSSVFGSLKKGIITIAFEPQWHDIWPSLAVPIATSLDELSFRGELNDAHEAVKKHVEKMEAKRKEGKLKTKRPRTHSKPHRID